MGEKIVCLNCGKENSKYNKFCTECGIELNASNIQNYSGTMNETNEDTSKGNKYAFASIILIYIINPISAIMNFGIKNNYFSALASLCPLIGISLLIIGRINYPKNILLKIVMWVIIIGIVIIAIGFIALIIACSNMDTSGCG